MGVVEDAIYDRLTSDVELMGLCSDYRGSKAVFTVSPIPTGMELGQQGAFIVVMDPTLTEAGAFDTKNSRGEEFVRDIACYQRAYGDNSKVDRMAAIVRGLFHRRHSEINVEGFGVIVAKASGPQVAPTDDTMYGRVVTVTITAAE